MSDESVLAHDNCARVANMPASVSAWATLPKCPTCDALDAIWETGYDAGKYRGELRGRYDANQRLARVVLLFVIMGFLIGVVNHRATAGEVTE